MKKLICLLLTAVLLISVPMTAMVFSASAGIVPTSYGNDEYEDYSEAPSECPAEEYTEPCIETCAPEPEPTECPAPEPTEPMPEPTEPEEFTEPATEPEPSLPYDNYEYPDSDDRGKCGANAYWDYYNDGRLIVHGTGDVDDDYYYYANSRYPWYKYRESIKIVIIEGVNNVPNCAFRYYYNLESVIIGDEITSLGIEEYEYQGESTIIHYPETFMKCENLKSVSLGNNITFIPGFVFYGCKNLSEINLPDLLTSVGAYAFSDCNNLELQLTNNLSRVGNGAFQNCSSIESIEFKNAVDCIGDYAFSSCTSLRSVVFDDTLNRLGTSAFSNCSVLSVISLPDDFDNFSYSSIADTAFVNDEKNWTNGVLYINNHAVKAKEDIGNIYKIKNGTKKILAGAFSECKQLEAVEIPDSVSAIGNSAFSDCSRLKSVKFGKDITDVGFNAFNNCVNIEKVDIPNINIWCRIHFVYSEHSSWEHFKSYTCNPLYYGADLYVNGKLLTDLVIDHIETIDTHTFYNCKSLKSVTVSGSVSAIGDYAFFGCSNLISVTVSGSVSTIGAYAFFGCSNLQEVKIKKNVDRIGGQAFWNCVKLKDIFIYNSNCTIPSAYETISGSAVIHGYDGSTAQMYAGNFNRTFMLIEDEPIYLGDVDGDGGVSIIDATYIQRHLAEIPVFVYIESAADTDGDGSVTIIDATCIQRYLVQLACPAGIGEPIL